MTIKNLTLLALLLPAVWARPREEHGHAHFELHKRDYHHKGPFGSGMGTGTGIPFPAGNSTTAAATGTGPRTITSTLNVYPQPIVTTETIPGGAGGPGSPSPTEGSGGSGGSPGSGESGSAGGSECGPATVTVTSANTVTVTVTPSGESPAGPSGPVGPGGPGAGSSSSAPPFPAGNSTSAVGTGTGTAPPPPPPTTSSTEPISPAAASTSSVPHYIRPVPQVPEEKYKKPEGPNPWGGNPWQHGPPAPPSSTSSTTMAYVAAPPSPPPESPKPVEHPSPSATPSPKSKPSPNKTGKKGAVYNDAEKANGLDLAWACNWQQTANIENPTFQYVPQLWGQKNNFAGTIAQNAADSDFVLFYNEPDIDIGGGGSSIGVEQVISDFGTYMAPMRSSGKKVSTPCVANSNSGYMETFLQAIGSGEVDIMCFHWYGNDVRGLQGTVETFKALAEKYDVPELWISEMAVLPAPSDLSPFLDYLNGAVDRYAYNLDDLGSLSY